MEVTFPHRAMWQSVTFNLVGQSLEGQQSISGVETVVPTLRGRWQASMNFAIKGEAQVLQWQAFLAQMEGRVGTTLVPARSRWRPRDRDGHHLNFCKIASLADAQTWEHFGFASTSLPRITLFSDAPLRATEITVENVDSTGLRPGQFFSLGEGLYRVLAHWSTSSATSRLRIQPPLRRAFPAGAGVEVGAPVCRMRFASEDEGLFDQSLDVLPVVSVNFMEVV